MTGERMGRGKRGGRGADRCMMASISYDLCEEREARGEVAVSFVCAEKRLLCRQVSSRDFSRVFWS